MNCENGCMIFNATSGRTETKSLEYEFLAARCYPRLKLTEFVLGESVRVMLAAVIKHAVKSWIVKTAPNPRYDTMMPLLVFQTFDIRTEDIYPAGELLQSFFSHKAVADISG